jgi:hypothetical protein
MEWIKTEEYLPEDKQIVLTCDIYNSFVTMAKYLEEDYVFELMYIQDIEQDSFPSHWMPLPNLPKDNS